MPRLRVIYAGMVTLNDRLTLDGTRRTSDGYLVASVRAARTGIQDYAGFEVGRPDMERVRVYRPADEVFNKDAMASFTSLPITVDHPPVAVTADNWREYAVGNTGEEIARDGEFIRIPLIVKDAAAIRAVESGRSQISMGYTVDLKWEPGKTDDGLEYDAVQTGMRGNHLAFVRTARGGPELKIGDNDMTTRTITVDGIKVTLEDQSAAIVEKALAGLDTARTELATAQTEIATLKTDATTKDAEIATLKTQVADATSPEKMAEAVRELADATEKARAVIGDTLVTDGKSAAEIRKQVVDAKMGDTAKDWTEAQVSASFAALTVSTPATDRLADALTNRVPVADTRDKAQSDYVARMTGRKAA